MSFVYGSHKLEFSFYPFTKYKNFMIRFETLYCIFTETVEKVFFYGYFPLKGTVELIFKEKNAASKLYTI